MPAQPQVIDVPFIGGVETKFPPGLVPPGRLLVAQDCAMRKRGRIEKRWGFAPTQVRPPETSIGWVASYGSELLVGGPTSAGPWAQHAWSPGLNGWVQKGSHQPIAMTTSVLASLPQDCWNPDLAIGGPPATGAAHGVPGSGFSCVAFQSQETVPAGTRPQIWVSVRDEQSGAATMAPRLATSLAAYDPRLVAIGPFFVLLSRQTVNPLGGGTISSIFAQVIDPVQGTVTTPLLLTGTDNATSYDARLVTGAGSVGNGGAYVAIAYASASPSIVALGFDPWLNQIASGLGPTSRACGASPILACIGVFASALGIAYIDSDAPTAVQKISVIWTSLAQVYSSTLRVATTAIGFPQAASLVQTPGGTGWTLLYEEAASSVGSLTETTPAIKKSWGALESEVSGTGYFARNATLAADPFAQGTALNVPACYGQGGLQNTYFVLGPTGQPVARFAQQTGGGPTTCGYRPAQTVRPAAGGFAWAIGLQTQQTQTFNGTEQVVRSVARATCSIGPAMRSRELGPDMHLTGGFLAQYDGTSVVEHGFHVAPESPSAAYCSIGCCRSTLGVPTGSNYFSTANEVDDIFFPPDLPNPDGTVFGAGWQIRPGSYVTLPQQSSNPHAGAGSVGYFGPAGYVWFSVDGVGVDPQQFSAAPVAGIQCALASTDTSQAVAQKFYRAVSGSTAVAAYVLASAPQQGTPPTNAAGLQSWYVALKCVATTYASAPAVFSDDFRVDILATAAIAPSPVVQNGGSIACCPGFKILPGGYFVVPLTPSSVDVFYFQVSYAGSGGPFLGASPGAPVVPTLASGAATVNAAYAIQVLSSDSAAVVAGKVQAVLAAHTADGYAVAGSGGNAFVTVNSTYTSSIIAAPYSVNAGGVLPDGFYQETVDWEWTDATGLIHRSAPALPLGFQVQGASPTFDPFGLRYGSGALLQISGAGGMTLWGQPVGGSSPTLWLPALWATQKNSPQACFYRTTVSPGENPQYHRVSPVGGEANPIAGFGPILNPSNMAGGGVSPLTGAAVPAQDVLLFLDGVPDSQAEGNADIYTGAGAQTVLSNQPVASCSFLAVHQQRMWAILTEQPNQLWASQLFIPEAQVGVAFAAEITVDIDQAAGSPAALATLDDKLLVLASGWPLYIAGAGPTAGGQGGFNPPLRIMTDAGCSAPVALESFDGVWFQSPKGLYFCDRGMNVTYRGQSVEALVQGMTCMAAQVEPVQTELRFFMAATPGAASQDSDYCLVYNYITDFWSQSRKWGANAACLWNGTQTFGDGSGNLVVETPGAFLDGGAPIGRSIQTAWWGKQMGSQGYFRAPQINVFGAFGSTTPSKIQILVGFDYEQPVQPVIWDPTQLIAAASGAYGQASQPDGQLAQFRAFTPTGMRGGTMEAISFVIQDIVDRSQPNDPGMALDMVSLAVQPIGGLYRLGPLRSTG